MPALLVLVPLIVLLTAFVGLGYQVILHSANQGFIGWLARALGRTARAIGYIAPGAEQLTRWVAKRIGTTVTNAAIVTASWVSALAVWVGDFGSQALEWPMQLWKLQEWLVWHEIPRQVRALAHGAVTVVTKTVLRVQRVERTIVKLPKLSRAQAKALVAAAVATYIGPYLFPLRWLRAHFHALTAVIPHALPIPFGQTITAIRKRLRRLERALPGTTAFAAAVAVALGRLGIGWVRCNNVRRVGREICGLNPRTITDLLGLFADVLILTNICRVFTVLEEGLGFIQPEISAFVGGVGSWACYGDNEHPPRLVVPALDLPASASVHGLPV